MKKLITVLITLLVLGFCLCADDEPSSPTSVKFPLMGHIYATVSFSVTIDGSVPFDLEDTAVAPVTNPENHIYGLRIGSYSLTSTSGDYSLFVLHDRFQLTERLFGTYYDEDGNILYDPGQKENIDYRLYMETGSSGGGFLSCKSSSYANLEDYTALSNNPESLGEYIRIVGTLSNVNNRGLYVVLEDNETAASALKAGTYSSTLYFYMVVGK